MIKVNDRMVATDKGYWGSYEGTTVIITQIISYDTVEVETWDGKIYNSPISLLTIEGEYIEPLLKKCECGVDKTYKNATNRMHSTWCRLRSNSVPFNFTLPEGWL